MFPPRIHPVFTLYSPGSGQVLALACMHTQMHAEIASAAGQGVGGAGASNKTQLIG